MSSLLTGLLCDRRLFLKSVFSKFNLLKITITLDVLLIVRANIRWF